MESQASVEIDRPIQQVYDYTVNNVPEWSIVVVEDHVIEETPEGVGTTVRIVTEERGRRMEFDGVVTRQEPPHHQAIHMTGKHFDIDVEYEFEDLGGDRTRLTQRSVVHGKGFTKVMFVLFGWLMKKTGCDAIKKEFASLKMHIEGPPGEEHANAAHA